MTNEQDSKSKAVTIMMEPKETPCSEKGKSSLHPLETIGDNSACQKKDTMC